MSKNDVKIEEILKFQTIDSAALAGAATAATLTVFSEPGPYVPMNAIVGITLLAILLTYELRRYRTPVQNFAFGAVCALCALLVMGFLREWQISGWEWEYWIDLESQQPPQSNVRYWFMFAAWAIFAGIFTWLGSRYALTLPGTPAEESIQEAPGEPANK